MALGFQIRAWMKAVFSVVLKYRKALAVILVKGSQTSRTVSEKRGWVMGCLSLVHKEEGAETEKQCLETQLLKPVDLIIENGFIYSTSLFFKFLSSNSFLVYSTRILSPESLRTVSKKQNLSALPEGLRRGVGKSKFHLILSESTAWKSNHGLKASVSHNKASYWPIHHCWSWKGTMFGWVTRNKRIATSWLFLSLPRNCGWANRSFASLKQMILFTTWCLSLENALVGTMWVLFL